MDDNEDKIGKLIEDKPVLGLIDELREIVIDKQVDLIVVAIHNINGIKFRRILELCQTTSAQVKIVPNLLQLVDSSNILPLRDVSPEDLIGRSIITKHDAIDLSAVSNRRVLITGAAGSIGSEVSRQISNICHSK